MQLDRIGQAQGALGEALTALCRERSYRETLEMLVQGLFLWRLGSGVQELAQLASLGGPFSSLAGQVRLPETVLTLKRDLGKIAPSPEEAGLALEGLHLDHAGETGKLRGAYYTPPKLTRFMARLALSVYLQELARPRSGRRKRGTPLRLPETFTICDPAVGAGAFLAAMLDELAALPCDLTGGRSRRELSECLHGWDRDSEAVYLAKARLWLQMAEEVLARGEPFPALAGLRVGDSLQDAVEPADIVIENPPYLRQESLSPAEKDVLSARFGSLLPRQADLYSYFLANLSHQVRPRGVAVLVTPVAWLEVDYGRALQELLLKEFEIPLVIASACERWFSQAAVHTVVTTFIRRQEKGRGPSRPTAMVNLTSPLEEVTPELLALRPKTTARFSQGERFRVVTVGRAELTALTRREAPLKARWGTMLRAPAAYFSLQAATCDKWTSVGEVAQVTRGFTSGANAFFFLRDVTESIDQAVRRELEAGPGSGLRVVAAKGSGGLRYFAVEERFLFPLVKSPREVGGYLVLEEELNHRVLLLPPDKEYVARLRVAEYLRWGEEQGFDHRPTTRTRSPWWSLPKLLPPQVLARQFYDQRFNFPYNPGAALCDHTFYYLTGCADPELFAALLNSTLSYLYVELWGRSNMGDGVLTFYGPELTDLPLPRPEIFSGGRGGNVKRAFQSLAARRVEPLEREVGLADRRELDLAVLSGLGVTGLEAASLLAEVYTGLCQLVKEREQRSRKRA
ncbi:MAG: HsdM family class I SAM-dependent methyltransferase [bacterium]